MAVQRINSGISGFDKLVEGGFPKGSVSLISGTPGTGKSIFCSQIAYFNALQGKKVLYVDFEETEEDIKQQMELFGWDLKKAGKNLEVYSDHVDDVNLVVQLQNKITKTNWDIVVIDSLASLLSMPAVANKQYSLNEILDSVIPISIDVESIGRMRVKSVINLLKKSGATCFVTSESIEGLPGYSRDTISEFLCDAVIVMHHVEGEEGFRTLHILKMRCTKQRMGIYSFNIADNGINIKSDE